MKKTLIPRFNYTLPFWFYIKCVFRKELYFSKSLDLNVYRDTPAYYTNTARTGLRLLLSSISNKRLRIGVQAFTCHTIFQAIRNAGHEIVFLDINTRFGLDLNFLKSKVDQIDVLIITHTFGYPDDFDKIRRILGEKIIIEDCAHSFLSKYKGREAGLLGDAAIFSFGLGKMPPIGTGGLVLINNLKNFPRFQSIFDTLPEESFVSKVLTYFKLLFYSILMHRPIYGLFTFKVGKYFDSKFDLGNKYSFHESKGIKFYKKIFYYNLNYFDEIVKKNEANFNFIKETSVISFGEQKMDITPNNYIIPVLCNNRDALYDMLIENDIEAGKHFQHSIKWATEFGYKNDCHNFEKIISMILTIPAYSGLKKNDLQKISTILNNYLYE